MMTGGDSGPALVPGKPEDSLLIKAISYTASPRMPPKGKLPADQIVPLAAWIKQGALWPETDPRVRPAAGSPKFQITARDRAFWSFQPTANPALPTVHDTAWPKTAVDYFILAKCEANGLHPASPADRRTLLRRVTFDLIGLMPTPEEMADFLRDESPNAFS